MTKKYVLLAQTDTTVGFLSQNSLLLSKIKARDPQKPFLKIYPDMNTFKKHGRIPNTFKRRVRRSSATSYVVKEKAFRVIHDPIHRCIVKPYGWLYSTSANLSGHSFDREFAEHNADIVIEDRYGLHECPPSAIIRLGLKKIEKLR